MSDIYRVYEQLDPFQFPCFIQLTAGKTLTLAKISAVTYPIDSTKLKLSAITLILLDKVVLRNYSIKNLAVR